jgi:GTP-binding protein EngB required for normal cell division
MIGRLLRRKGVLSRQEAELRLREQELLDRLGRTIERLGPDVDAADARRIREARDALGGFFLLVVAGEFNSGKSSFINALLGERVLPEGVTPTTDRINLLRHGDAPDERVLEEFLLERTHPATLLREMTVVDTPGTNAVIRRHEELTREFVPRSDLILFVTSADRPFSESERSFLEHLREWGKKIVFVVNKVDILGGPDEIEEVTRYVRDNAEALLGEAPPTFCVSARRAVAAREAGDEAAWAASGFDAVERYLLETLDEEERVRLKLLNPLNVALRFAERYREMAFQGLKLLAEDVRAIDQIDRELAAFHEGMLRDLEPRLGRLEALVNGMETRGMAFFDETIRIGRIRSLLDSDSIRREFEREVIADTPARIDEEVGRVIDWLVERNLEVWQHITGAIDRRRSQRGDDLIGEVPTSFAYNRQALLDSVGRLSREVVGGYNREAESRALANEVQGAFATTALAEAGAVGLGALVATVVTGAFADVTGILLATTLAVGGFYVIPRRRRQAKARFREKIGALRRQLVEGLTRQVHVEVENATERINGAIAPYRRFVHVKQEQLNEAGDELVVVEDSLKRLRAEIQRTGAAAS